MTSTNSTLKSSLKALVLATGIGLAAIAAAPMSASAAQPTFSFSVGSGGGVQFSIGSGRSHNFVRGDHRRQACYTNSAITRGLQNYGFRNVHLNGTRSNRISASATRGLWNYTMIVDRCTGDVSRLDRHPLARNTRPNNRGFHFNFRF